MLGIFIFCYYTFEYHSLDLELFQQIRMRVCGQYSPPIAQIAISSVKMCLLLRLIAPVLCNSVVHVLFCITVLQWTVILVLNQEKVPNCSCLYIYIYIFCSYAL